MANIYLQENKMSQAKVIDEARADGTIVLEIEDGYSVALVEIPEDMEIDEFFKTTEEFPEDDTDYPAEHAAPHTSPTRFDKFRSGFKKNEGKAYRVIYGRVADTNKWEVATTRYPVEEWTADEAKEFCKSIGGIAFDRSIKKADDKDETLFPIAKNQEYHVKKKDEDKHLVYGIVLEPNVVDLQGDYESEEEIEKAAHRFMLKLWMEKQRPMIGAEHKRPLPTAIPEESNTAK